MQLNWRYLEICKVKQTLPLEHSTIQEGWYKANMRHSCDVHLQTVFHSAFRP